jgi:hypothetical protein
VQAFDWNVEQFYWRDRGAEVDFVVAPARSVLGDTIRRGLIQSLQLLRLCE